MTTLNKIFVVIDPTTDNQTALANVAKIVSQSTQVSLHVYEAIYSTRDNADPDALQRVVLDRHQAWVESLVKPIRAAGNEVTVEIEWTSKWRDAIAPAAEKSGADLIVKTASVHGGAGRRLLKTSDWTLLRNSHCPVYLIKKDVIEDGVKVLVALDIARDDELHSILNEKVLEYGRAFVGSFPDSSLHAVNAYPSSETFIHQCDLAATTGIERTYAHTVEGAPEKVIPEIAEQIDAGIVVIGTAARHGYEAMVIGNTVEKILDSLDANILTVKAA